jgi:hypothetical protein
MAKDEGLTDRGVTQTIGGTPRTNGTLSLASRAWGVGSATTGLGAQTNVPVDLVLTIPVAEDQFDLTGSLFLQQTSSELSLELNWANPADLFTLTGNGAATFSGTVEVNTTKFEVPTQDGAIVIPDLSHVPQPGGDQLGGDRRRGERDHRGRPGPRQVRAADHLPAVLQRRPAAVHRGQLRPARLALRHRRDPGPVDRRVDAALAMERQYNSDLGGLLGFQVHEFAKAGFRDLVDMGTTSDLRLVTNVINAPTNPKLWYAVESLYKQGQAA